MRSGAEYAWSRSAPIASLFASLAALNNASSYTASSVEDNVATIGVHGLAIALPAAASRKDSAYCAEIST